MKLGMLVGLGPGHILSDGHLALPRKGAQPPFSAHICCGQMAAWIKMPLGMDLGLGPCDFVVMGTPLPSQKRGRSSLPNSRLISIVAKRLEASICHLV